MISAYNEELSIKNRLENFLEIDYPSDRLEVLIGSDGSTDNTNEIVRSFNDPRVRFFNYPHRGKISVLNKIIPESKGEIIVFSDANTYFAKDALKRIVRRFADSKVGVVCGELKVIGKDRHQWEEGTYWRYEIILKFLENRLGLTLGANGAIYAIRKALFKPISEDIIIDDFVIPMKIMELGYKGVYDYEAKAYEESIGDTEVEFERRVRIGAGGFQAIQYTWRLLNPCRGFIALAYWSHKILRWAGPFLLIACLILSSTFFYIPLYMVLFFLQLAFYILAVIGYFRRKKPQDKKIFRIPFYFVYINFALLRGFFRFITGRQKAVWKRTLR